VPLNLEKYRALFVEDSSDHLAEMSSALAVLERRDSGDPEEAVDCLFRGAHSIKGMAASLEYDSVATLAHELEDWLEPCRRAGVLPDEALPVLYEIVGVLESMVAQVAETGQPPELRPEIRALLAEPARLDGLEAQSQTPDASSSEPAREAGSGQKKALWARRPVCRAPSVSAPRRSTGFSRRSVS